MHFIFNIQRVGSRYVLFSDDFPPLRCTFCLAKKLSEVKYTCLMAQSSSTLVKHSDYGERVTKKSVLSELSPNMCGLGGTLDPEGCFQQGADHRKSPKHGSNLKYYQYMLYGQHMVHLYQLCYYIQLIVAFLDVVGHVSASFA